MASEFRVYRIAKDHPEERQEMIVPDPNRGFVCASEVNEKRAFQWAHTFSETDRRSIFEVRGVTITTEQPHLSEFVVAKFKAGRMFL